MASKKDKDKKWGLNWGAADLDNAFSERVEAKVRENVSNGVGVEEETPAGAGVMRPEPEKSPLQKWDEQPDWGQAAVRDIQQRAQQVEPAARREAQENASRPIWERGGVAFSPETSHVEQGDAIQQRVEQPQAVESRRSQQDEATNKLTDGIVRNATKQLDDYIDQTVMRNESMSEPEKIIAARNGDKDLYLTKANAYERMTPDNVKRYLEGILSEPMTLGAIYDDALAHGMKAEEYVDKVLLPNIEQKVTAEMVARHTPKSTLAYLASSTLHQSLLGRVMLNLSNIPKDVRALKQEGLAQYDEGLSRQMEEGSLSEAVAAGAEKLGAMALPFVADAGPFRLLGAVSNVAGLGRIARVSALSGNGLLSTAARMGLHEGGTFGLYEGTSGLLNDIAQDDVSVWQAAKNFGMNYASGALTGFALGSVKTGLAKRHEGAAMLNKGHFGKPQEALRAGEKFAATTAVFAVSDVMKRWATDPNFDINDVDWGDVLANSALTTMMIELAAAPDKIRAARAQKEALANIHFTEADKTAFRNAGIPVVRDGDARKWLFQNAELYADLDPRQQLWNRRAMDIVENKVLSVEQKNTLLKAAGLNPVVPVMETTKVSDVQPYVVFDGKGNPVTQYRVDEFDGYGTFQKRAIFATEQEAQQYREEIGEPVVQNRLKFWQQQSETIKLSKATPMAFEEMSRRGTSPQQMSEILAKDEKALTEGERKVKEDFLDVRQKFVDATETFYDIALAETAERHGVPEEAVRGALESDSRTELGAQVTNDFMQLLDEYSQPDVLHDKSAEEISRMLIPEDELEQLRTEGRELYASGDAKAMHEQVLRFRAAKERANDGNTADRHLLGYYLRQKAIYDAMLETHNGNHSEAYSTAENFAKSELMADADGNVRVVRMGDNAFVVLNADMDGMIVVPVETAQDGTIDFASADRSRARSMMRRDAGEIELHNVDEVMRSMYPTVTAERDAIFGDTKPEVGQVVETVADEQGNVVREMVVNNDGNGTWLLQREDGAQRAVTEEELTQMLREQEQRVDDERYFKEEVEAIKAKNRPRTDGAKQTIGQEPGEAAAKAPEGVSVPRDADGNADLNGMAEAGTSVVNAIDALNEAFDGDLARAQRVVASKVKSLIKQGKEAVEPAGEESGDLNAMAAAARERSAERAKLGREQEYWLNLLSEMTGRKKEVLVGDIDNPDNYRQPKEIAREQIEKLAGKLGVKVEFTDNMYDTMMADASIADKPETVDDANQYNGYRRPDGTIVINTNSEHALVWTIGHETGHQIEKAAPQQYEVLKAAILDTLDPRFIAEKLEHLKGQDVYSQDKENELLSEIANDGLGRIFTDEKVFAELMRRLGVEETKTLADRIKSWVEQAREQGVMSALKQTWDALTQKAQGANPSLMDGERGERLLSLAENAYKKAMESGRVDKQGNPIDENGKLFLEKVKSLDEISDDDFIAPKRNVVLPQIPESLSIAIGAEREPVIIKKNIFEKNKAKHPEISSQESRSILHDALYNTNIVGNAQPIKRPDYRVAIHTGERNSVVVLDIYRGKDNVEIVGWRRIDEHGLRKMKKQAEREGGQFLILSPKNGSAAALSALPRGLSSESKGKDIFVNDQENGINFSKESEKEHENARLEEQMEETKRLMAVKKDYEKGLQAGRKLNWRSLGRGGLNEISVYGLEWGLNNRILGHRPNSIISEGADGGRIKVNMSPQNLVDTRDHIDALERLQREYVTIRKSPVATDEARRVIDSNIYAIDYAKRYYDLALQGDNAILKMEAPQFSKEEAEPKEVEKHPIFLSNAEVAVRNIKQDKATAEQWLAMAEKMGGIKAGEDKWMGLSDWLRSKKGEKLTKDEVLKYIMDNSIQVEDVDYREVSWDDVALLPKMREYAEEFRQRVEEEGDPDAAYEQMVSDYGDDFALAFYNDEGNLYPTENSDGNISDAARYYLDIDNNPINTTRLEYTTKGLKNKREIALVVPDIEPYHGDYREIHFDDNATGGRALAWARFGDSETGDGERVIVVDEVQSQRFEDAKKRGGLSPVGLQAKIRRFTELERKLYSPDCLTIDEGEELQKMRADGVGAASRTEIVPDAPFAKNWHELAMKRMLRFAAENGYDKLAWTTGDQQAERYALGGVVDEIDSYTNDDGSRHVMINMKNDKALYCDVDGDGKILSTSGHTDGIITVGQSLGDVIGKELAQKVINGEGEITQKWFVDDREVRKLSGEDLRLGGEGMKGFYDEILPRFMNKYGKKWGVKVHDIELPNVEEAGRHMWAVDITPEMKESVMQGQVMFSKENSETLFKEAKKHFGRTYDLREAGYILPDGTMLNFSGKHWMDNGADASSLAGRRTVDHRDVRELAYERDGNTKTGIETAMTDFIRSGAIRIDDNAGLINLSAKPTPEQRELLRRLVSRNGGQVQVEIGDGDMSEAYVEYDNAKPSKVLADIDRYFDEGIVPQGDVQFSKEDFSINSKKTSEDDWQIGEKFVSLHSERDREAVREQRNSMSPTAQWREGVGDVMIHSILPIVRKKYADLHEKAKAGDVEAAFRLVKAVVKESRIRALAEQHPNAKVAFVHAEEATGTNRIPEAYANELADYGFGHTDIVQTNKPQHTGSDRIGRMIRRVRFDGEVEAGAEYILVDDHVTMGGTLRDLKDYIESKGGKVVAVTTLTASAGGSKLQPTAEQIEQLKQKGITNEQLKELGIADDIAGLTKGEARELLVLADARADRRPASGRPGDLGEARRSSGGREKGNGQGVDYSKETPAPREGEDWKDYAGRVSRWMNQKQRGATDSQIDDLESIRTAIAETDTNPSEAEKKSGNYKMGHAHLDGYQITIENPAGSVRRGTDPDGKSWETKMHYTYGYIRGTKGKDGDHVDIFLSENPTQGNVYVVDQVDPKTGKFDEHKVMYGFQSEAEARDAYLSNYEEGWKGLGYITGVSKEEFRKWVDSSKRKTKPFSEYASVRDAHLSGEQSGVSFSKDGRRKRHSAQLDLFGNPQLDLFRDRQKDKTVMERIKELADGDLLQEIGSGEMRDWDFYQEEYDRRHNNENGEEVDSYTGMLMQGKTSLNDAYRMYADIEKRWRSGGYATEERTALRAQMDALTDYIDRLEFAEGDEVQGLEGYTRQEVLDAVRGDVEEMLEDSGIDVEIKGVALNGSRLRGDARKDSDLDVVLEYDGDVSEDALFNILNENPIEFDGIKVDINPITEGKSGTLEQYMARSRQYDEEVGVRFSKDAKRNSAQMDLFEDWKPELFRDGKKRKDGKERLSSVSDERLLLAMRHNEADEWSPWQAEYDRRHESEYEDAVKSYTGMLEHEGVNIADAYQMYANAKDRYSVGGFATDERTALRAQMDALADYIGPETTFGNDYAGERELKKSVIAYVDRLLNYNDIGATIEGVEFIGGRTRRNENRNESEDLDVIVEYSGDVSEEQMRKVLNDGGWEIWDIFDENQIEALRKNFLSGEDISFEIDIKPTRVEESGTLRDYRERVRQYESDVAVRFSKESEDFAERYSGGNEDKKAQIADRISKINTIKKKFGQESLLSEENLVSLQREIKKPIDHFYNVVAEKVADEYIKEKFGSGTNVIDPDELRERAFEVVGYDGTNVSLYGKNDDLIAKVYRKALAKAIADNNPTVILLTGHAGAGKSTSLRISGIDTSKAGVVYDSAFNTYESLARAINTAKGAGVKESDIRVVAVYNDPVTSFSNTLARAKKEGRTVPFKYFFGHAFVSNNGKIRDLSDNFPEVNIVCLDNSRNSSKGEVSLDEAKDWDYGVSEQQFEEALKLIEDEINRKERGLTEHQIASITRGLSGTRRLPHRLDGVAKRIEVRLSGNGRRESVGKVGGGLTPDSGVKYSKDSDIKKGKSELWKRTWDEVKDNAHYRDMLLDLEPHTIEEVAAGILRGGGLLWGDVKDSEGKVLVKGVRSFMGYKEGERKKFFGLFTSEENGGRGFERVGEEVETECQRLGIPYDENDPMAGVNALQSVLSECGGKGQLNDYIQYKRVLEVSSQIKADEDAEQEALDEEYYDRYGMDKSTYDQIFEEVSGEKERRKSKETIDLLQRKVEQQNEKMERMWTELKAERTNKEGKAAIERLIQQNKAAREENAALRAELNEKRDDGKKLDNTRIAMERRENIRKQLIDYIREQVASEWMPYTTKQELNKLLSAVQNATTQEGLEKAMLEVRNVSTAGMVRAQQQRLDRMLALKVQGVNGKNMSIAKTVDDRTRVILQGVNQRVMDNKMTGLLERMDDLRRNRMKVNAELRRLRRDGDSDGRIPKLEEDLREMESHMAATEQEMEDIRQAKPGTRESDINEELKALEEKMDRAARKEAVWTTEDTDLMTQLKLMQALIEPRDFEVQEAKARKDISEKIDVQKAKSQERNATTDDAKRHELTGELNKIRLEIEALKEQRNQAQMARSEALSRVIELFDGVIKGGRESLQAKTEREAQRRIMLIREAVHSVWGKEPNLNTREGQEEAKKSKVEKYWKALVSAPMSSFDYMTQRVSTDGVGKDSWLYRHFMEGKDGVMEAYNTYLTGMREQKDALNAKVEELFGTKNSKVLRTDAWVKQAAEADKIEDHSGVTMVDAYGNRLEMPMSKGQATYIWARWQMADGKVKLQNQGFDDTSIAEIEKFVGPKYIELAKWLSSDFLAGSRAKYNERYREMYNTSMARIENYVPMSIFKGAVFQQSDLSENAAQRKSLDTRAGSLINRNFNVLPVDITQSIFDAISAHVEQMENWYAYARVRRDLDAILSNTYFRNQLNANHAGDFERFYEAAAVATKSYIPKDAGKSDESISILNKGLVAGNIAFRLNTALKQLLSAPAYLGYSQNPVFMGILAKNCATGALGQNWKWCYDHIPSFRDRVDVGDLGDNRLSEDTATAIGQRLQRYASIGMIPNRIVDGVTVSIGAKAIHDYALRKYLKLAAVGNPTLEERAQRIQEAHRMAKMEADIFYNQTQQSSHPAFLSSMQLSRSLLDRALTVYQNANLGYTRAMMNAARDLISAKDYQRTVNGLARRYESFGLSTEDAMRQARQDAWKKYPNLLTRLGLFGWGLKCAWNWGSNGLLGFLQNDDDEKRKDGETQEQYEKRMALRNSNDFVSYLLTPVHGTGGGNMLLTAKDIVLGEDGKRFEYNPIFFLDQLEKMLKDVSNDIQDGGVINSMLAAHTLMHISKFSGIDPQTWGNIYIGVEGLVKDGYPYDDKLIDIMYILNTPRSGRMEAARTTFQAQAHGPEVIDKARELFGLYRPNATEEEFQKVVAYADGFMTHDSWLAKYMPGVKDAEGDRYAKEYKTLSGEYQRMQNGPAPEKEESAAVRGRKVYRTYVRYEDIAGDADVEHWHQRALDTKKKIGESSKEIRELGLSSSLTKQLIDVEKMDHEYELNIADFYADYNKKRGALIEKLTGDKDSDQDILADIRRLREEFLSTVKDKDKLADKVWDIKNE